MTRCYFTYILKCEQGCYYIGSTKNIKERLEQHNSKIFKCWTNKFDHWKIVYSEGFETRILAFRREKQIKSYKGGEAFKKLVNNIESIELNK